MKYLLLTVACLIAWTTLPAQDMRQDTYCNPLNIDYTYMIYNSDRDISYRSGADPAVVEFRGEYYMFVTRSHGYWRSRDLLNWEFVRPGKNWYPQGCNAPAAHNYKDSVLYVAGDPSGSMSILYTDNPASGDWEATPAILHNLQDPDLFIDDDGKAYMFWGSSNVYPIRGMELDKNHRFTKKGETKELFNLDMPKHGWERFGENHTDTVLGGYIEGPWLTKHNGKYYMQYGAPGTEFNVYADGVYVADHPMGPYTYQKHNPVSYKPGGYMNGAGHGSTVLGPGGQYWHFASMSLSINVNWERRLCMFPAGFDKDGIMYCDTRFGDYPRYAPAVPGKAGEFRGWMLLSYGKPVTASTTKGEFQPSALTDELTKTFWLAEANDEHQWVMIDLEKPADVCAIQINYHDYQSDMYGRYEDLRHRYIIEGSLDGQDWKVLVDRKESYKDTPNDYVELSLPEPARYIRYKNIDVPTPNLAISELRVFGLGTGKAPQQPKKLFLDRYADRRDVAISWEPVKGAQGYNVLWGIAPDKLYSSWMVYGKNDLLMKSLTTDQDYYFCVEAFNEKWYIFTLRSKTCEIVTQMKRIISVVCVLFSLLSLSAQETYQKETFISSRGDTLPYRLLRPETVKAGEKYPLVLFLHGAGERGNDNERQLTHGGQMFLNPVNREKYPAFVLVPQCPVSGYWAYMERPASFMPGEMPLDNPLTPVFQTVKDLLDTYLAMPQVDKNRVYIIGLSMGGMGTFDMAIRYPEIFAAAVPICGTVNPARLKAAKQVKFRIFHGDADNVVTPEGSRAAYKALKAAGADVEYIEFSGCNHGSWNPAFNYPGFMEWIFSQKKK